VTRPAKEAAYQTLVANRTFIVLDIETTTTPGAPGQSPTTYPVSIGAVVFRNGTRRETFHTLTDPGVEVDPASSAYNGLTTADLVDQPDNPTALAALDQFLAASPDAYLVCHNALFDVSHLHDAYRRAGMAPFTMPVLDTEFLPTRLRLPWASARPKLTTRVQHYESATTLPRMAVDQLRLHKALLDAQNTAEVLGWLLAETAAQGVIEFEEFLALAKPKLSTDLASRVMRRRRRFRLPTITSQHVHDVHSHAGLPEQPADADLDAWVDQVHQCVQLHCPYVREKVSIEAARSKTLLPRLTALLATATGAGDTSPFS
jgi:DNA polymerase III alpha subunit (gram-positive type)